MIVKNKCIQYVCVFLIFLLKENMCRVERGLNNNVNIKVNKIKSFANSKVGLIRTTTIETINIYRFGVTNYIVELAGQTDHTIKKARRKNNKPRKFNTYALRL